MSYYIQIGAGAGDLDERSNFKDGFTEYVKKNSSESDYVFLVEPNSLNISKLENCWLNFPNSKIFNLAIVDSNYKGDFISIFYTKDDGPCYQVSSTLKEHVVKHYPQSKVEELRVKSLKINDFIETEVGARKIEYLAIDAEGIDYKLIMDLNFEMFDIDNISIEFLHLTNKQKTLLTKRLIHYGYSYNGRGFDVNGYDLMFSKKMNFYLKLKTKYFLPK